MKLRDRLGILLLIVLPMIVGSTLNLSPDNKSYVLLWEKAMYAYEEQEYQAALEQFDLIHKQKPWNQRYLPYVARSTFQLGQYQYAIDAYSKILDSELLIFDDYLAIVDSCYRSDQKDKAQSVLEDLFEQKSLDNQQYQQVFTKQKSYQDIKGAYRTLKIWEDTLGIDFTLPYEKGLIQVILDPALAGDTLLQAIRIQPQYTEKIREIHNSLEEINNTEDRVYQLVLSGQTLAQQGEWLYAESAFSLAAESNPEYAEAWALLANAQNRLGKDGTPTLNTAIALAPDSILVRAMLAYDLRIDGEYAQSLEIWQDLAREESSEPVWQLEIANSYISLGNLDQAIAAFQKTVTLAPENPYYWKQFARFCVESQYLVESIGLDAARNALKLDPEDAETLDILGWIFLSMDDFVSAERFLSQAESRDPHSALIKLHLGQLALKKGQPSIAFDYLNQSVLLSENRQITEQANRLLNSLGGN